MKLLITGGAGFIGSNFVRYWLDKHPEDKIVVLDKLTYAGNLQNLAGILGHIEFVKGDICDEATVEQCMSGCDLCVHFAAESHVDRSILGPDEFIRTNVVGTHVLLKAALKHKLKRFHHVSTDEVFGAIPLESEEKWTESSPYAPRSPYSASKAGSDHLVRAYFETYGLPISITNSSNNFGPYHFPEKFIPLAITNLLEGKKIPIYTPGNQVRDWLHVTDHCRAIEAVLLKGRPGETYLVGSSHREYSNLEVAKLLLQFVGAGEDMLEFVKDRPGHDAKYAVDISKISQQLGWEPLKEFEVWLKETVAWYQQNEKWWKAVKNGEYQKYYQQQYGGLK
jgi:dTDP-glucose 4,6-dehydratase